MVETTTPVQRGGFLIAVFVIFVILQPGRLGAWDSHKSHDVKTEASVATRLPAIPESGLPLKVDLLTDSSSSGVKVYVARMPAKKKIGQRGNSARRLPNANGKSLLEVELPPQNCLHGNISGDYYRCRRTVLLQGCSEICDTHRGIEGEPSLYFKFARKHVDCDGLWANEEIDAILSHGQWPPPYLPPAILLDDFAMGGQVEVVKRVRYVQRNVDAPARVWTKALIDDLVKQAKAGTLKGTRKITDASEVRAGLKRMNLRGKRVLVLGSKAPQPWLEACALEAGVAEVHTLEQAPIISKHPKVFAMTPAQARARYANGTLHSFDAVLSYSSVQHFGLGRYGDALNPWGDMQAIARAWCVTKPGGAMLLGVMQCGSKDRIEFNMHRCYHTAAFTHLTANWQQTYRSSYTANYGSTTVHLFSRQTAPAQPGT